VGSARFRASRREAIRAASGWNEAAEQGDEADEARSTSELRSLSPVFGGLGMCVEAGG
jgi:hypothetical protein